MAFYCKKKLYNYFVQAAPDIKDIIAFTFIDNDKVIGACMTWGKVFKEEELLKIISTQCLRQGFHNVKKIHQCYSLQEICKYPYFYERWTYFVQQNIPYKFGYKKWILAKQQAMREGQDIKFIKLQSN